MTKRMTVRLAAGLLAIAGTIGSACDQTDPTPRPSGDGVTETSGLAPSATSPGPGLDDAEPDEYERDENEPDEYERDENERDENEPDENEPDENERDENERDENEPDEG